MGEKNNLSTSIKTVIIMITSLLVIALLPGCSSSPKEYKCTACNKIFTNSADTRSIAKTNLCEPCYQDYKNIQELKEAAKQIEERGN